MSDNSIRTQYIIRIALVILMYAMTYGMLRWRSVLICEEYYTLGFKTGPLARKVVPGRDLRVNWIGKLKNGCAYPAWFVFYPLVVLETRIRS